MPLSAETSLSLNVSGIGLVCWVARPLGKKTVHGRVVLGEGDPVEFVYSEVFTFADGLIRRLDTFHIWLGEVPAA